MADISLLKESDVVIIFEPLLSLVRQIIRYTQQNRLLDPWILHAAVSTLLQARDASSNLPMSCSCNVNEIIKELLLFCFDDEQANFDDEDVDNSTSVTSMEKLMELALYLILVQTEQ